MGAKNASSRLNQTPLLFHRSTNDPLVRGIITRLTLISMRTGVFAIFKWYIYKSDFIPSTEKLVINMTDFPVSMTSAVESHIPSVNPVERLHTQGFSP